MREVGRSKPGWSAERTMGTPVSVLALDTRSCWPSGLQGVLNVTAILCLNFFNFQFQNPSPPPPTGEGIEGGIFLLIFYFYVIDTYVMFKNVGF